MPNSKETLDFFRDQLSLEADYTLGYAVVIRQSAGKELMRGVGASPHAAMTDLLKKWEKG
jgi:hypothetical protein